MKPHLTILFLFLVIIFSVTGQTIKERTIKFKALTPNLLVDNVNKSADFYEKTFGFKTLMSVPESGALDFAMIKLNDVTIMLQSIQSMAAEFPEFKGQDTGGTFMLYIDVENLDEVYEKAKLNKVEIFVEINKTFYGTREFTIKDPDGYLLIFAEDIEQK